MRSNLRSMRAAMFVCIGVLLTLGVVAQAQQVPTVGTYTTAATASVTALQPIVEGIMPMMVALLAILLAPSIIRTLVKKFAKG